jgi:imidazoleglycerol-phosphate dehydratase
MRKAKIERATKETQIALKLSLDETGPIEISTGVGFFDHMLTLMATHGLIGLQVKAKGDLEVDQHHTVEDVGISLGAALKEALGEKRGIARYGWAAVPMDEALSLVAIDLSGRGHLELDLGLRVKKIGGFDVELVEEFLRAFANSAGMALHLRTLSGKNSHHIVEAGFKAVGRALAEATKMDPRRGGEIPSSKGVL